MQDNKSCVLLHTTHPFSVGKGSKHTNIRYFFVVDKIDKKEAKIVCCSTEEIVADFSSKPLQRKIFVVHRNTMLDVSVDEFKRHKQWHREALQRHELWDEMEGDYDDMYLFKGMISVVILRMI